MRRLSDFVYTKSSKRQRGSRRLVTLAVYKILGYYHNLRFYIPSYKSHFQVLSTKEKYNPISSGFISYVYRAFREVIPPMTLPLLGM